ncbi:Metallo-dependent phosphatase, partial [Atractiella rhizophila]
MLVPLTLGALSLVSLARACSDCYGPSSPLAHNRIVPRMQPDAQGATTGPRGPLAWGQINFLHTTDTHGWLEGHLGEQNYGADWGDFASFTSHMKDKAKKLGVDLLLVDTGDLHDGAGLSDATSPNGAVSLPIFENIQYDLLTIGNHELYVTEVAYETFRNFSKAYGERYLTSNVQIANPSTGDFEYIGQQYRYFKTDHGLRIMAFGVLFDFTGNSNVSKVIPAAEMVKQDWFISAVNYKQPIDLFVLIGHNPVSFNVSSSSMDTVFNAIRSARPDVPIQGFGGHTHIRDFRVWDQQATGLESGRYCETVGWLSMSGIKSSTYHGNPFPAGVPHPTQLAISVRSNSTKSHKSILQGPVYFRRYLDWNRRTFAYHAVGSQNKLDTKKGVTITNEINATRTELKLTSVYGCAPATYCISCKPFGDPANIFSLLSKALSATVVNATRADKARIILINTGSIRFDLVQGPFTYDDSFIVSPFDDKFQYIADVPWGQASKVL